MQARLIRCFVMTLALALTPLLADAQRGKRETDQPPPSSANSCSAPSVRCLFGRAGGCTATCPNGTPVCEAGGCILGIPFGAHCTCA